MPDYQSLTMDELKAELTKQKAMAEDAQAERDFMGKQTGQHINASVYNQIDHDIEKYDGRVKELEALIAAKS
jgi:hypothetical protein